ncbi:methionine adenosyltransferase [Candidatus Woesearchaeota archaeon]|nr:methionine adenosyltransferase [Candidatus Woesearchaeota archaeon]|tara:strand:+ start:59 stop:1189 length:1131 start_codon:yes stop_codon:yes gene_type:complete
MKKLFTSESVTEGHPDKICDQISDAILDELISRDSNSRVAVETLATKGLIFVTGEVTTKSYVDIQKVVRDTLKEIGYTNPEFGLNYEDCGVIISLNEQSPDISQGVNESEGLHKKQGAGDQGLMFGYATNETENFMPLPIDLAHKLTKKLAELRKNGTFSWSRPDGKAQVTVEYEKDKPKRVDTIVIAIHHDKLITHEEIKKQVIEKVIIPICGDWIDHDTKFHINATGKFVIGGPQADAGLTGRKIIVDTYGGMGRHGGGAFSGKDPSKVDRSAAYAARFIAKNIVSNNLAEKCEIQLAYSIGVAEPVSISVNTFGTSDKSEEELIKIIKNNFELEPSKIIEFFNLKNPIYKKTAAYGHFGRSEFPWEKLIKLDF